VDSSKNVYFERMDHRGDLDARLARESDSWYELNLIREQNGMTPEQFAEQEEAIANYQRVFDSGMGATIVKRALL
jgi:hypothetical protein